MEALPETLTAAEPRFGESTASPETDFPGLRFVVAPVRSGTTAFLHTISHHPRVATASGLMKRNLRVADTVDYGIYERRSRGRCIVYRALFGPRTQAESTYQIFRTAADVDLVAPLFVLREPVATFSSWLRVGYVDLSLFLSAYDHVLETFAAAREESTATTCIAYEYLAENAEDIFPMIFRRWGLPQAEVLPWRRPLGWRSLSLTDLDFEREKLVRHIAGGLHRNLMEGPPIYRLVRSPVGVPDASRRLITQRFSHRYAEVLKLSRESFPL